MSRITEASGQGEKNMKERTKRFWKSLKQTLNNVGNSTGKILSELEKSDKELQEKIKKATGGIE